MPKKFKIKIMITQIREYNEKCLENIDKNDDKKRLSLLIQEKTTIYYSYEKNNILISIKNGIEGSISYFANSNSLNNSYLNLLNNYSILYDYSILSGSTCTDSKIYQSNSNLILLEEIENKFNSARVDYCLRYKLYDIPLTQEYLNFNHPPKYIINEEYFSYVYPNEQITYLISISGFLFKGNNINNLIDNKSIESKYFPKLGLFFCGNNIEFKINNKEQIKKCEPNEFICKKCLELNKNIYKLEKHYLINILGRVAKINKGSYHCFGHFMVNNELVECITRFTCKGCKLLNIYSKYYQ